MLDTDVYYEHVEFTRSNSRNLFTGTPTPFTEQNHATHVTGSIVGVTTGGVCIIYIINRIIYCVHKHMTAYKIKFVI